MVACSVQNCRNRTSQGVRLFRFPRDPTRRKIWASNCGRGPQWQPTDNSRLCECHFDDTQYEQRRQDKWKKLKNTALPTLFNTNEIIKTEPKDDYLFELVELPEEQMAKVLPLEDEIELLEQDGRIIDNTTKILEEEKIHLENKIKLIQQRLSEMTLRKSSIEKRLHKLKGVLYDTKFE